MPSLPIECFPLEAAPEDWAGVEAAFAGLPEVPLLQSWRAASGLEPAFRPAAARFAWREDLLYVNVEMEDADVFNPVTAFNQPAFQQGDVVEVFLHAPGTSRYCEIHSTPGGAILQLGFRVDQRRVMSPPIADPVSRVLTRKTARGWSACLQIPFRLPGTLPRPGSEWFGAVCRYDHTRGLGGPVLSSTAAFTQCDFHQIEQWNPIRFH